MEKLKTGEKVNGFAHQCPAELGRATEGDAIGLRDRRTGEDLENSPVSGGREAGLKNGKGGTQFSDWFC